MGEAVNVSLSLQSMSSSGLMNDCESGSELKEAKGGTEEETVSVLDDKTAVGGAKELLLEEAGGSCSISPIRKAGQTIMRRQTIRGCSLHGGQRLSMERAVSSRMRGSADDSMSQWWCELVVRRDVW